jgi:hypothetical protein
MKPSVAVMIATVAGSRPVAWSCAHGGTMSEIIIDYKWHAPGDREVVDWDRRDGKTYRDVPIVYLREVTARDYMAAFPDASPIFHPAARFWEVSVD